MERNYRHPIFSTDEPFPWHESGFAFLRNALLVEKNKDILRSIGTFRDFSADSARYLDFMG